MSHLSLLLGSSKSENTKARTLLEKNNLPYHEVKSVQRNDEHIPPKLLDRRRRRFTGVEEIREAVDKYLVSTEDGYFPKTNRTVLRECDLNVT